MTRKKFIVYPGEVYSANDGDLHYVSARQLMHLYQVAPAECIVVLNERDIFGISQERLKSLIPLRPRYDGNYRKE